MDEYIKIEDLVNRGLYKIDGRNASAGVWITDNKYFLIRRYKFGMVYIDREDHWDVNDNGTAQPIELIQILPDDFDLTNNISLLKLLEKYIDLE